MRKWILRWLFGTDDIKSYMELLTESMNHHQRCRGFLDDHLKTLEREKEELNDIKKFLRICENHGIDVDEEMKKIE